MTKITSSFGASKGQTLELLANKLNKAKVLPLALVSYQQFNQMHEADFQQFFQKLKHSELIVRSSFSGEDSESNSMAGQCLSVSELRTAGALQQAINAVFASYPTLTADELVLIQPQISAVKHCGVIFSRDLVTGSPYYVIADDCSGHTDKVTSGQSAQVKTFYSWHSHSHSEPFLKQLAELIKELSAFFQTDALDIEYAIDSDNQLWLFQVRPLSAFTLNNHCQEIHLQQVHRKLTLQMKPHPFLFGDTTVFGVMPDWNPAEIIGLYPKPLALSLYKELITNSTWAYQRNNYGYCNLRSFPLMVDFLGLPYIDVRVSFNSFLPKDIKPALGHKLVNYYLDTLKNNPNQHDSVEFDIVLSCYTPDIQQRFDIMKTHGFTAEECTELSSQLLTLTNKIIDARTGLWIQDLHRIEKLKERHQRRLQDITDPVQRIYWLLEDCKRYGTLPFAGLARAAFIAVQLLQSFVRMNVFSEQDYQDFLASLTTISGKMTSDLHDFSKDDFLKEYGHLRPGTYDICSPRYDQAPHRYFNFNQPKINSAVKHTSFELRPEQQQQLHRLLTEHGLNHSPASLLHFIKSAIEGREYSKFIFTRSLSDAMEVFANMASSYGFSREDAAFADITIIYQLISGADDPAKRFAQSIAQGKENFATSSALKLPPLLSHPEQAFSFVLDDTEPNFITHKHVTAAVSDSNDTAGLTNKIVFIASADPGFDWIFSHQIAGFITAFGGCNSHMAIRAAELGIPAVIGAGEQKFTQWRKASLLELDCMTKTVRVLQ